ncbi:hypothetical protein N7456_001357 [Penicillium angulare]|uniref:Zn(2)-C6 fungal-type domain-containing protein n=1 Tax=Penicillium angulare TaxID=116970 RepID=A0A9W9GDV2_9EURO|nr:hypothetical protein N7456_001357 [Penicillium angulare]
MSTPRPSFNSLPLQQDGPRGNAWGLFGDQDQLGKLNLLTPENTVAAAREITDGVRVSTDWALDSMATPCFGRSAFQHTVKNKAPRPVNDDVLTFNTQSSSQWDGFRHYGSKEGSYYNGCSLEDIQTSTRNGIHVWVENGGIVGRGVLLDYAAWAETKGVAVNCFTTQSISLSTLQEVAASQNVSFRQGDILFIRTGWTRAYEQLSAAECQQLADFKAPPVIGVESSEEMLRWIWDEGFAAVAGDMPSFEAYPCQNPDFFLHEWLLAGWGLPIGELFDLERLSQECRKRDRWSFFFSSVPLNVPGGVASPPNGVAIFYVFPRHKFLLLIHLFKIAACWEKMVHGKNAMQRSQDRAIGRSMVACNRCRNRKTRCAGNPPLPCAACVDVGHICVYSEAEKRVSITESYFRHLQSQARASREPSSQHDLSNIPSTALAVTRPEGEVPLERDDWWYKGTDNLFLNRSGEHQFVGASSTTHLAKRLNPSSTNLAWDVRPLYDDPSSLRRPVEDALPQLPPFQFAKRLFWVQYAYIGTIFSLIHPAQFEERLEYVYHQPHDFSHRETCLIYCQVLLVMAFGLMYSVNQWSGDDGPPGFKYFKHALRFLPDIHEEGSIFFVEVLCYVAYYMQNLNRRDAAFLYIGLALRMAISLGLHQEVSNPDISEAGRNRRRRAWWSVYSLDRLLTVKSGNPITLHDEDIGTTWPSAPDGSTPDTWPSIVLIHYTQLSRILGRIGEEIYRKKPRSGSSLIMSMQSITDALSSWLRQAPGGLRIDFSTLDSHISRETVSINLHFYSCVNMTARPLVFYVIQRRIDAGLLGKTEDWKEGLASNTVAVIDSCITAARATTLIMDAAAKKNLIATYGYLDGEYIFSAALLLVMVNAAFPYNEINARAMETALNLLRSVADRGNSYLSSRHSLLLELRAALGPRPNASANVVDDKHIPVSKVPTTPTSNQAPTPGFQEGSDIPSIPDDVWQNPPEFPSIQDVSFQFDPNDDSALWEGALHQIDIDMDTDWIENTLRR